jgi:hypothetical protein
LRRNVTGVISWKKPREKSPGSAAVDPIKKTGKVEFPGPGQYNLNTTDSRPRKMPSSMFASKVARTATATNGFPRAKSSHV